ncbi:Lipase maturation factor 1 [Oopsacas minuta]|uniref:Lipase maturation factor n=1 Tax=Oopsacas minuta TaxID=111878 RepID=A0AAV7JD98_9METZ|nr:Lipase maturation factor 1 [Oopsacas minuta]
MTEVFSPPALCPYNPLSDSRITNLPDYQFGAPPPVVWGNPFMSQLTYKTPSLPSPAPSVAKPIPYLLKPAPILPTPVDPKSFIWVLVGRIWVRAKKQPTPPSSPTVTLLANQLNNNVEIVKIYRERERELYSDMLLAFRNTFYPVNQHWLTRIVFLRCLAIVYTTAFLVALQQNPALIGSRGILPVNLYLNYVGQQLGKNESVWFRFIRVPTLLWFVEEHHIDFWLDAIAWSGVILSSVVLILGASNMIIMVTLWLLYHSLVNVGQIWYSFGWESQLLETGFLAIFLCPFLSLSQLPPHTPPSLIAILGNRWLIFRIMLGAGLIKIRGDQCWRDLTCMNYHYETQPVPNPLSYYMHQSPEIVHKMETMTNHIVELVSPWFLVLPRPLPAVSGIMQISFMFMIVLSGNLSFLNWLTMLPSIFCLNDGWFSFLFSKSTLDRVNQISSSKEFGWKSKLRSLLNFIFGLVIAYLSIPIVQNLFSSRQVMNTSFDAYRIVNTYGAFGSITKQRTEIIIEATWDNPSNRSAVWHEYEFHCKPGNTTRRPCTISPYHYRLDWLMWFAAFQNYQSNPWFVHLIGKLLSNDSTTRSLLASYPPLQGRPSYIRAKHYSYEFTQLGSSEAAEGHWWKRKFLRDYFPPVRLQDLAEAYKQMGWVMNS